MSKRPLKPLPPVEFLRECFDYDSNIGELRWKKRPREHFTLGRIWKLFNNVYAGRVAGTRNKIGYRVVSVRFSGADFLILGHRAVWALATGSWPLEEIDHIDGNPSNNHLSNLREATRAQQGQNIKLPVTNTSGYVGVMWDKRRDRWMARIEVNGRVRHLGYFDAPETAYAAYLDAKQRLHPFQPVPRKDNYRPKLWERWLASP